MKCVLPIVLALATSAPAVAQQDSIPAVPAQASSATASAVALAEGEVRRIDKDRQRITIRHGVIPSLDMPPMTMVFGVADAAMLDQVKVGQKIRFDADKRGSTYTVTHLENGE